MCAFAISLVVNVLLILASLVQSYLAYDKAPSWSVPSLYFPPQCSDIRQLSWLVHETERYDLKFYILERS